jgi:agmatine deiminase
VELDVAAVAHAVRRFEPVTITADPSTAARARSILGADIEIREAPLEDAWFRDSGPTFVEREDGSQAGVCWRFNGWGGANAVYDNDAALAGDLLGELGVARVVSALAVEGGALAVDGAGTLLTTDSVVLNPNRNPGILRRQAEAELARTLGIRKTIWLPGNPHVFGTNGHVDGLACFVRPGVVMFQLCADDAGQRRDVNDENRAALEGETDADGRALEILLIREAPATDRGGPTEWTYSRSYINFYVANGGIVMPSFGLPGPDAAAHEAIAAAFPDRTIAQVDISHLAAGGGGIHCITQQQPEQRGGGYAP